MMLFFDVHVSAQYNDGCFRIQSTDTSREIIVEETFCNAKEGLALSPFEESVNLYGLSVNMDVNILADDYVVRVVLEDSKGEKHLVAELFKEVATSDKRLQLRDYCEETAMLAGVKPVDIKVYANNAEVILHSIKTLTKEFDDLRTQPVEFLKRAEELHKQQAQVKIEKINTYNRNNDKLWTAGLTSLAQKPYEDRMRILGCPDGGNTYGMEYYMGGIIDIGISGERSQSSMSSSSYIDEFDWRIRHGKNWLTSVKDQGNSGYCCGFSAASCTEALVNLYLNDLVNLDLSDQEAACCNNYSINTSDNFYRFGMAISDPLQYIRDYGVCDEISYPFVDDSLARFCHSDLVTPQLLVTISGYSSVSTANEDNIKNAIIHNGPLASGIYVTDGPHHAMTLVGFGKIKAGDIVQRIWNYSSWHTGLTDTLHINEGNPLIGRTYWIFKNSYINAGTANPPYMLVTMDLSSSMNSTYSLSNPTWMQRTQNGTYVEMNDVVCEDADGDGYYFWGLGPKPSTAPAGIPNDPDGDDSDPLLGTMDQYGFCEDLNPATRPVEYISTTQSTTNSQGQYSNIEITNNATWTVCHDRIFYNGARILIKSGSSLNLTNNALLDNVKIDMESGATLVVTGNGKIHLRNRIDFNPPVGAIVRIEYGELK